MIRNRFSRIKDAQFYSSLRLTQFCSYDRRCLDSVSEAARALIFGLLELDPSRRLTASQALEHPFITQLKDAKAKVTPRRNSVLEKLQRTVTVIRGYQVRVCRWCCDPAAVACAQLFSSDIFCLPPTCNRACSVCCAVSGKTPSGPSDVSSLRAASGGCRRVPSFRPRFRFERVLTFSSGGQPGGLAQAAAARAHEEHRIILAKGQLAPSVVNAVAPPPPPRLP